MQESKNVPYHGKAGERPDDLTLLGAARAVNWPTPTTQEWENDPENWKRQKAEKAKQGINKQYHLSVAVNWPTPDCTMRPHEGNVRLLRQGVEAGMDKNEADAMLGRDIGEPQGKLPAWPTASARDWKDTPGMSFERKDRGPLGRTDLLPRRVYYEAGRQDQASSSTTGNPLGLLNPDWVETLMGLPIGWTDLGSWGTE